MSLAGRAFIGGMHVVPKKAMSKGVRRLAAIRSKLAVRRFAALYDIAIEEAEKPLDAYESVLDLFTRRLKPGVRPIDPDPDAFISCVDGAVLVAGDVGDGALFQAKGKTFSVSALLADSQAQETFKNGSYITVYLAPHDYHRIHTPVSGQIGSAIHVPGALYPVNPPSVAYVDRLFARNERLITRIDSERFGRVDVVKVGATNVGHITAVYDDTIATNTGQTELMTKHYETPIAVARGDELGVFEMGSTVIVVTERRIAWDPWAQGQAVRLGRRLGQLA